MTYPANRSGRGRRFGSVTIDSRSTARGTRSGRRCWRRPTPRDRSTGRSPSTPRSIGLTSMRRTRPALSRTGAGANHKNRTRDAVHNEPAGHAIGRSRGGLTTKIHHAVDGRGRPLAAVVTAGQSHDGQQLKAVLDDIWVSRASSGRPRTTSDALLADKAYSSAPTRVRLRARGIQAVIPERDDQKANRRRRGRRVAGRRSSTSRGTRSATSSSGPSTCSSSGADWPLAREARHDLPWCRRVGSDHRLAPQLTTRSRQYSAASQLSISASPSGTRPVQYW